jgi:hypothetical protein
MKWQFKIALFLLILSQVIFFVFAAYNIERKENTIEENQTLGYSWIWYHPEQWLISLVISFISLLFFIHGLIFNQNVPK